MAKNYARALATAVYANDIAALTKLVGKVKADAEPYNSYNDSQLMGAINNGASLELVKLLVESFGSSLTYKSDRKETPISVAQMRDRKDLIDYFASRGAKVKYVELKDLPQNDKDARLTKLISDWTDDDIVKNGKKLLAAGADPTAVRIGGSPVLHFMASQGMRETKLWDALIAAGADPKELDDEGNNALHVLADGGSELNVAKYLLGKMSVDVPDRSGNTPLHHAVQAGYWNALKFVQLLVAEGANLEAKNKAGKRAIDLATGDAKTFLLSKQNPPLSKATVALLKAIRANNLKAVTKALADRADPMGLEIKDEDATTALHEIFKRDVDRAIVDAVLAHPKLSIDVRDGRGETPLHRCLNMVQGAARQELADRLIELGADLNAGDNWGSPPWWGVTSFYKYDDEIALYDHLVAAGANPKHRDNGKHTVLDKMWESTQRFSEVNDKKGYYRMLAKLVADKVPSESTKYITTWLKAKADKYGERPVKGKKPEQAKVSASKALFAKISGGALAKLVFKDAYLPVAGTLEPVALFDWYVFNEAANNDEHEFVDQIHEYHIAGKAIAHVKAERWIPFAVVGMTGSFDSYEEISVDGTLYVDLTKAKGNDAPVVFATQSYLGLEPTDPLVMKPVMYSVLMKQLKKKG